MAAALENDMTSAAGRLVVPGIPGMPQNSEQAAVDVTIVASANDWAVLSSSGRSLGTSARRADYCPSCRDQAADRPDRG
jgi:hypothetical protein